MSNEVQTYKITSLVKINQVASYNQWAPNKIARVRLEFGELTIEALDINECDSCDFELTADNVDVKLGHAKHVECPKESQIVSPMPGFKAVGKFRILK